MLPHPLTGRVITQRLTATYRKSLHSGRDRQRRVFAFQAPHFGKQGDLLTDGDHALAGLSFVLNFARLHPGMHQCLCDRPKIGLGKLPPVTQFGNEFIVAKPYCCMNRHGTASFVAS